MKSYVLTGGPGVGKTTMLELLASRGYAIMPEAARVIIEEEMIKDSNVLLRKNLAKFQKKIAQRQLGIEKKIPHEITFLDRSIIDGYAFCVLGNVKAPEIIFQHAKNRYDKIFLLEPLHIYKIDAIRKESEEFAVKIHDEIIKAYAFFGYNLIRVPALLPEKRVDFILKHIL
jgi:predicted ATPase